MVKYPVYLGACDTYDPQKTEAVITQALGQIPLKKQITGKVVIKPNLVLAPLVRPSLIIDGFVAYPLKKLKGIAVNSTFRSRN